MAPARLFLEDTFDFIRFKCARIILLCAAQNYHTGINATSLRIELMPDATLSFHLPAACNAFTPADISADLLIHISMQEENKRRFHTPHAAKTAADTLI